MLRSSAYRSRPMGPVEQPDFVNAAAALLTQLDPATLLRELQALETRLGREAPVVRWGHASSISTCSCTVKPAATKPR